MKEVEQKEKSKALDELIAKDALAKKLQSMLRVLGQIKVWFT
jgi:hypothetical protein